MFNIVIKMHFLKILDKDKQTPLAKRGDNEKKYTQMFKCNII